MPKTIQSQCVLCMNSSIRWTTCTPGNQFLDFAIQTNIKGNVFAHNFWMFLCPNWNEHHHSSKLQQHTKSHLTIKSRSNVFYNSSTNNPPWWPSVQLDSRRSEDQTSLSSLESCPGLIQWYSCGYPARCLALQGQHKEWLAWCQYTGIAWVSNFYLQLLS